MLKNEFIPTIAPLVEAENKKRGNVLFNSVVIAQAICESGWGQSKMMMKANAIFGIKATTNWKGKVYVASTQECYDGVNYTTENACFRAYNSLEDSISDYFDLITRIERYRQACVANSPLECITAIKNGGYATSPTYVNTIMSIINTNNLTKYDVEDSENNVNQYYTIGNVYTLQVDLNVRVEAGTNNRIKKCNELTADGQKHAYKQTNAVLKKGTKVTCQGIRIINDEIWIKIPSGWVAGIYKGKEYIK